MSNCTNNSYSCSAWKRVLSFCLVLAMVLSLLPATVLTVDAAAGDTLYMKPCSDWLYDSPWFAVYFFGDSGNTWSAMTGPNEDGYYETTIPNGNWSNVIFCRMNPANTALSWDAKWNQTGDLTLSDSYNCFVLDAGWNGTGSWTNYTHTVEEPTPSAETTTAATTQAASGDTTSARDVVVHYRNTGLWSNVNAYAWITGTDTALNGGWPGSAISATEGHANWYTASLKDVPGDTIGIIFNNGSAQTSDIIISNIPASGGEYWYDGQLYTAAPSTWADGSVSTVECQVTLHFADSLGWGNVSLYTWTATSNPTGSWPGAKAGLDSDGFYSLSFTASIPEGQGLNFIFNNGGNGAQTVDLSLSASEIATGKVEKWVQPTSEVNDDDTSTAKFNCDSFTNPEAIAISPVVDGTSVTFEYKNTTASSVVVKGSWDSWANATNMTPNEFGVWSVTLKDVQPGIYEYKFVVDGTTYVEDPCNTWKTGPDNNSAFIVLDPNAEDTNTITVKIHYNRADGNYENWNAWIWTLKSEAKQYDLEDVNGEKVITMEVNGRSTQYVSYIFRKSIEDNKWAAQEYGERQINVSDIVSGTVHYYVNSGVYGGTMVLETNVVKANKISSVELDYSKNTITVVTNKALDDPMTELALVNTKVENDTIAIKNIAVSGSTYTLTPNKTLDLVTLYQYKVLFEGYNYDIGITGVYATDEFAAEYTYTGTDLGATWGQTETVFRVPPPEYSSFQLRLMIVHKSSAVLIYFLSPVCS